VLNLLYLPAGTAEVQPGAAGQASPGGSIIPTQDRSGTAPGCPGDRPGSCLQVTPGVHQSRSRLLLGDPGELSRGCPGAYPWYKFL